jgi:hypothetical protein
LLLCPFTSSVRLAQIGGLLLITASSIYVILRDAQFFGNFGNAGRVRYAYKGKRGEVTAKGGGEENEVGRGDRKGRGGSGDGKHTEAS